MASFAGRDALPDIAVLAFGSHEAARDRARRLSRASVRARQSAGGTGCAGRGCATRHACREWSAGDIRNDLADDHRAGFPRGVDLVLVRRDHDSRRCRAACSVEDA